MSDRTRSEWVRNPDGSPGVTWNPIRGTKGRWHCTKVSPGCRSCYAERMNIRFGGPAYVVDADELRLDEEVLRQPARWRKPRTVFVQSMSDLFDPRVPTVWLAEIWQALREGPHTWIVLTKRARGMSRFLEGCGDWGGWITHTGDAPASYGGTGRIVGSALKWPKNSIWVGVTAENQESADERIPHLLNTPAAVRWVSCEPLLGPIDLCEKWRRDMGRRGLDWVVCGSETGPGARPCDLDWVRSLRDQCVEAGVPFFFKAWVDARGRRIALPELDGQVWDQMPVVWSDWGEATRG